MQTYVILVALVIFIVGGIVQQNKNRVTQKTAGTVQSAEIEISQPSSPSSFPTQLPIHIPTLRATVAVPSPTALAPEQQPADLQMFRYPGTSVVSSDVSSMQLTSTNDADTITNWYKDKIKADGFNTTAFAVTNTNGNVFTKLAGASGRAEVRVEITKKSNEHSTQITVTLHTY